MERHVSMFFSHTMILFQSPRLCPVLPGQIKGMNYAQAEPLKWLVWHCTGLQSNGSLVVKVNFILIIIFILPYTIYGSAKGKEGIYCLSCQLYNFNPRLCPALPGQIKGMHYVRAETLKWLVWNCTGLQSNGSTVVKVSLCWQNETLDLVHICTL